MAQKDAQRIRYLANRPTGIPATGAVSLLREDAYTQGPKLFKAHCASCHRYEAHDGLGFKPDPIKQPQTASDLKGFGSRQCLAGVLDPNKVATPNYLGAEKLKTGKMVKFVKKDVPDYDKNDLNKVIAAVSAEAQLPYQRQLDQSDAVL